MTARSVSPARKLLVLALLALVLATTQAAAQSVWFDHDQTVAFKAYNSFAWKDFPEGSLEGKNTFVHSLIVNSLKSELTRVGLIEDVSSPDLYVTYYASTADPVRIDTSRSGYSPGPGWLRNPGRESPQSPAETGPQEAITYPARALVVDIWETETGRLVFRGVAEDAVVMARGWGRSQATPPGDIRRIQWSAKRIVSRFHLIEKEQVREEQIAAHQAAFRSALRRWSFGAGVSSRSTIGSYGNNAGIINTTMFGEDGIPGTGDPGELTTCTSLVVGYFPEVDPFCDPRPDDLIAREGRVEDDIGFGLTAAFDLTPRVQLAFDAAWYQSEIGPIDVYTTETYPFIFLGQVLELQDREFSEPIPAGEFTQIPLTLTATYRMRLGKAMRPYVGAGAGLILSSVSEADEVDELDDRLETLRIRGYADEKGRNITPLCCRSEFEFNQGLLRYNDSIEIEVDRDALEWHLAAGLEYAFNERFSVIFDARYLFVNQEVSVEVLGEDQVDIYTWPDELYHPNGSLAVFHPTGGPPNPLCAFAGNGFGCQGAPPGKRVTPNDGTFVMDEFVPFTCPGSADFDKNGLKDFCYVPGLRSASGREIFGMWVVQGGAIETSGYSFAVGLRARF